MAYEVQFDTGQKIRFEKQPSQQDIEEAFQQINNTKTSTPVVPQVPKKSGMQKLSNTLGDIFGGQKVGEAIGTASAKAQTRKGTNIASADYSRLTPEQKARLEAKGVPTSREAQLAETAAEIKGPTATQVAGDIGRIALNFAPVGKLATASQAGLKALPVIGKVAKPLSAIATGAGLGYAGDVTTKLAEGKENAFTPGAGTGIGGALGALPIIGKGIGRLGSEVLGVTTGTGTGTIQQFTKAISEGGDIAKAARQGISGNVDPEEIVNDARAALGTIIQKRSDNYLNQLNGLKTKTNVIDHNPIISKLGKQLDEFGVFANPDGTWNFSRSPGLGRYEKDLRGLANTLKDWGTRPGDNTIAGIDKLKQVIDDFRIGSADSKKFDTFVTSLRNEAKSLIKKNLKESKDLSTLNQYEKMLSDFEGSTNEIREIQRALSIGDKASIDTAFRKLTTVLRTNNEARRQAIQELNELTGGTLIPKIAGQQLNEVLPRGIARPLAGLVGGGTLLSGVGILPILSAAVTTSPRAVGEILNVLGIVGRNAQKVKNVLFKGGILSPGDHLFK